MAAEGEAPVHWMEAEETDWRSRAEAVAEGRSG